MKLLVAALLLIAGSAAAEEHVSRALWLRDHVVAEWMVGAAAWRTGLGGVKAPGFDALVGGTELTLGFDIGAGVGVVADGRFLIGAYGDTQYWEGMGGLALQVRLNDRVRLRLGPAAGLAKLESESAVLVGGFVTASIDLLQLGGGRLAVALSARLDVDAQIAAGERLPDSSLSLALGLGLRY